MWEVTSNMEDLSKDECDCDDESVDNVQCLAIRVSK